MKKQSQELAGLIKAMTRNEKGHFKKTALGSGSDNQYLQVFDVIDRTGKVDDDQIRKETGVKNVARTKAYLYRSIMRSLRQFHADQSALTRVNELIQDARVLVFKLLYTQAMKMLDKAEKIANDHELHHTIIPIYELKRYLYIRTQDSSETLTRLLEQCSRESRRASKTIREFQDYSDLRDEASTLVLRLGAARTDSERHELDHIIQDKLLDKRNKPGHYWTEIYRYQALHFYYNIKRDFEQCFSIATQMINHLESQPHIIQEFPVLYVSNFNFLQTSCLWLKRYDQLEGNFIRLEQFLARPAIKPSRELELYLFWAKNNTKMDWRIKTANASEALRIATQVSKDLPRHESSMQPMRKLFIYVNLAIAYFQNEQFSEAVKWLNKVFDMGDVRIREHDLAFVRIFNLILHFELRNDELLPYIIRSTYRYLVSKKRLFEVEKILLDLIRRFPHQPTQKELMHSFGEYRVRLAELRDDPSQEAIFEEVDYVSWLDSKLHNRPYVDLVRERIAARNDDNKS